MLSRSQQEKEPQGGQVCGGVGHGIVAKVCHQIGMIDEGERDRFYACRRWVNPFVALELLLETVFKFSA